jgi:hypothetical protein
LAIFEVAGEGPALDDDLAAQHDERRPGREVAAFPRGIIGLVQFGGAHDLALARVEQHDVGIGADRQCAFARVETHDLGGVGRDQTDKVREPIAALFDGLGVDQREPRLDTGIAAGRVVDPPPLQFDPQRTADLVGGDGLDRAMIGRLLQRFLIGTELQ